MCIVYHIWRRQNYPVSESIPYNSHALAQNEMKFSHFIAGSVAIESLAIVRLRCNHFHTRQRSMQSRMWDVIIFVELLLCMTYSNYIHLSIALSLCRVHAPLGRAHKMEVMRREEVNSIARDLLSHSSSCCECSTSVHLPCVRSWDKETISHFCINVHVQLHIFMSDV